MAFPRQSRALKLSKFVGNNFNNTTISMVQYYISTSVEMEAPNCLERTHSSTNVS